MRVTIYTRAGSQQGKTSALDNIKEQRRKLLDYCKEQNWDVVSILQDVGSTADEKRPGFEALKDVIADQGTDYVIVTVPDRLVRSMSEYMKLDRLAKANQVSILSL